MESPARHVSRWRLATGSADASSPMSLRYLNEFVGQLQCAPALLQHGLFPDAKEITESMGLFNAVRRYVLPHNDAKDAKDAKDTLGSERRSEKPDGIVVVGDGNTPRSAAMFAYRLRQWRCYSIDPAMEMQSSERSRGWAAIGNLVVVRNKIENVRISLRRAVVVLVHAHVTLEQALGAVDAEQVAGVVTMPCCNWYSRQEQLFRRHPDLVYDDFSILSDHREVRLWVGESRSTALEAQHSDFADRAMGMMKGCIRKEFCPNTVSNAEAGSKLEALGIDVGARSSKRRAEMNVVTFLSNMLDETKQPDASSQEGPSVTKSAIDAVAAYVPTDASILVLDSQRDFSWTRAMLQRGYSSIYTLKHRPEDVIERQSSDTATPTLSLELRRVRSSDPTVEMEHCGTIEFVFTDGAPIKSTNRCEESGNASVVFTASASTELAKLTHVVDAGFLYRGFRSQSKNAALFRKVCHVLEHIALACSPKRDERKDQQEPFALISMTRSKTWRKKEYFGHPSLGYTISMTALEAVSSTSKPLVVFNCISGGATTSNAPTPDTLDLPDAHMRDRVLSLKRELENAFAGVTRSLETTGGLDSGSITPTDAIVKIADALAEAAATPKRNHFVVTGKIVRIRHFSHGITFVSLVDADVEETQAKRLHGFGLQVFVHQDILEGSVPLADLAQMFRRGDQVTVVGFARTSDRGKQALAALAVKFEAGGEFEAF